MEAEQSLYSGLEESHEVRLTRFTSLDRVDEQEHPKESDTNNKKPVDSEQLADLDKGESNNRKWPWSKGDMTTMAFHEHNSKLTCFNEIIPIKSKQQVILDPVLLQEAANLEAGRHQVMNEPFQVVWGQLAFEVNTKTYDQLIGRALNRFKSMLTCSGDISKEQKRDGILTSITQLTNQTKKLPVVTRSSSSSCDKRIIFENLNGCIDSGKISAILGPSGAGKTSLINAISSKSKANYRGQVQLIGGSSSRMRVSVIPQKDYLIDRLTVKENLLFASKILNTDKGFDHESNILRIVKMLNLVNCFESSTGSISGGEYKRVSIAQELLKRPDILILDEPTSGLDSVNCKNLIRSLRSLIDASHRGAINPIAIVLTIHQPDVEIFHMFDHIYCMARGGRTIYEGHPSKALEVILAHSGIGECDPARFANVNPANLLIEIASEFVYGTEPIEKLNKYQLKQFEHLHQSVLEQRPKCTNNNRMLDDGWSGLVGVGKQLDAKSGAIHQSRSAKTGSPSPSSFSVHSLVPSASSSSLAETATEDARTDSSTSLRLQQSNRSGKELTFIRDKRLNSQVDHGGQFWHQMCLLTKRNFIADRRDPLISGVTIIFHLLIPFVMYIAYSKRIGTVTACPMIRREMELLALASNETAAKLADLQEEFAVALECSTMFFLATYCFSLRSLSMAALSFPLSMHVLVKESRNGWYRVPAYVMAKTLSCLVSEVLLPVLSIVIIYFIMEMPHSPYQWRLWALALVMALISLVSTIQGLIWGALCMDSVQTAIALGSASSLPLVLLSGYTARIKQMPVFMQYLSWTSLYRYSSDSINLIRFGFGLCPCDTPMDEYLKTKSATFTDLPDRIKPLFTFYLTNNAGDSDETTVASPEVAQNSTLLSLAGAQQEITGISYDMVLNSTVRNDILKRLETNELDLFGKMADLVSKSFTYGKEINGCESVRSQLLDIGGMPDDKYLPAYFAGLAIMFVLMNIALFCVVKSRVNKRI